MRSSRLSVVTAGSGRAALAKSLLDVVPSQQTADAIRVRVEELDDVRVADLHLWEIGPGRNGCIVSLVTAVPRGVAFYRDAILSVSELAHLTVEVQRCPNHEVAA
jgi:Co/Zn/Cd efflux system component